jgi:DNA-binding SARP family transcriptional activator
MTEDRSPRLELHTFGGIRLGPDDVVDAAPLLSQDKRLGVLLYLALARPRGFHRRDVVLSLFWPELSPARARHALNQTVYVIRQTLGNDVVIGRGTELGLDFGRWWVDAEAFREAIKQGDPGAALELYRGSLLNGFYVSGAPEFERWADHERSYHLRLAVAAACELAQQYLAQDDPHAAAEHLRWAARVAPYDEPLRVDLIRLLVRTSDRSGAIDELADLQRDLGELGVEPSAETEALADELRNGNGALASRAQGNSAPQPPIPRGDPGLRGPAPLSRPWRLRRLGTGVLVAAGLLLAAIVLSRQSLAPADGTAVRYHRLLVAPFTIANGQIADSTLVRGVADWITTAVVATGLVEVVGPEAVLRLPPIDAGDEDTSLIDRMTREATQRSQSDLVLVGTLDTRRDSLIWRARLMDPTIGQVLRTVQVATDSEGDPMLGIEALRDRVLGALSTVVDDRFSSWAAHTSQPSNYEAYRAFADGIDLYRAGEFPRAASMFEKAAGTDGTFTPAVLWAAWALWQHFNSGGSIHTDRRAPADSLLAVLGHRRATLSPWEAALHDHHAAISRFDYEAAYHAITRVVQQSPSLEWQLWRVNLARILDRPREVLRALDGIDSDARWLGAYEARYWNTKAWAYHRLERYHEELALAQHRLDDNPADRGARHWRFRALAGLGRLDHARRILAEDQFVGTGEELMAHGLLDVHRERIKESLSRLEALPENEHTDEWHYDMGNSLGGLDRLDEAASHLRRIPRDSPRWLDAAGELGWVLARQGADEEARRLSDALEGIDQADWRFLLQARIAASLGEKDRAVNLIAQMSIRGSLHQETTFQPLLGYPPFEELQRPRG